MVSILPCVSYQGMLTSQRTPRLSVRLGFTLYVSWKYAPPYRVRESRNCWLHWLYETGAPIRKSAMSLPVSLPSKVKFPFGAQVLRSLICRYRNSPPNFIECCPAIFENPSETCHVLLGWNVVSVGTPMEKLLK